MTGADKDEYVLGSIAAILVVDPPGVTALGRDGDAGLVEELVRFFVEANDRSQRVVLLGVEVEYILHPLDELSVDGRDAPHLVLPWFDLLLGKPAPDGVPRNAVVVHRRNGPEVSKSRNLTVPTISSQRFSLAADRTAEWHTEETDPRSPNPGT